MCGRYVTPDEAAIERAVEVGRRRGISWRPSYNTAPTATVPILVRESDTQGYMLDVARWTFVPQWWSADEAPRATINARAESAAHKPMWRDAFVRRRCLLPAMGWYEWQAVEQVDPQTGELQTIKQPYFLHGANGCLLFFAGLYSERADERAGTALTVAVITAAAVGQAAKVHDRMPVIFSRDAAQQWSAPGQQDKSTLLALLDEHRDADIESYPVTRRVNSPRNDDPDLTKPVQTLRP